MISINVAGHSDWFALEFRSIRRLNLCDSGVELGPGTFHKSILVNKRFGVIKDQHQSFVPF
jgi:hypothetical protein